MGKRVYIIHAWGENPESCWYPWLKKELEARGFDVHVPTMPNTDTPTIQTWVETLHQLVPSPDENIYFVGHSIGCQTILRYLGTLPEGQRIGEAVFVAPWTQLTGLGKDSQQIAKPWIETPIGWEAAKSHCPHFRALFSDNDPWVSLDEEKVFRKKLGAETKIVKDAGHFDRAKESPEALRLVGDSIRDES